MASDDELTVARDLAIDACGRIAEFWGFTRTMGRAFGLLYLSREPLPQGELQGDASESPVGSRLGSRRLAALGRWGVVHKVWVRGQRREHYQAETDFWKMISGVLNERERREIGAAVEVVGRAEKAARAAQVALAGPAASRRAKAEADFVVERVVRLGEICRLGETMLDMLLGQFSPSTSTVPRRLQGPAARGRRERGAASTRGGGDRPRARGPPRPPGRGARAGKTAP